MSKAIRIGECLVWTGARSVKGYGIICIGGRKKDQAHRYSARIHGILTDENRLVCHHCDNPSCVNPDHLFQGTVQDNNLDRCAKGRTRVGRGAAHANFKLDEDTLDAIKSMRIAGASQSTIGSSIGIAQSCVSRALIGMGMRTRHFD